MEFHRDRLKSELPIMARAEYQCALGSKRRAKYFGVKGLFQNQGNFSHRQRSIRREKSHPARWILPAAFGRELSFGAFSEILGPLERPTSGVFQRAIQAAIAVSVPFF
jgi:hypothetical protein